MREGARDLLETESGDWGNNILRIFKADLRIVRMCQIPTKCLFTNTIPSLMPDIIVVYIKLAPGAI